jgi:hypothetical protein
VCSPDASASPSVLQSYRTKLTVGKIQKLLDLVCSDLFVRCSRGDDTCLPSPGFSQVETSPSLAACLTTNRNMVHALLAVVNSKVLVRRVPSVPLFRQLLRVVRSWAQARKVYGAKNGFLGGFHWSCLVARVCVVVLRIVPGVPV